MSIQDVVKRCEALFEDLDFNAVKAWKAAHPGARAIGYMPIYVPREIIHAAGMLPVGVFGGGDQLEVIQGDAYNLRHSLAGIGRHDAAAIVSGLPLMTKPLPVRLRLLREAFALLKPDAPFVQFTYAVVPPIPRMAGMAVEASERIWLNLPPARVWVYRNV